MQYRLISALIFASRFLRRDIFVIVTDDLPIVIRTFEKVWRAAHFVFDADMFYVGRPICSGHTYTHIVF